MLAVNLGLARDESGPVLAAIQKAFMHVAVGYAPHLTNHIVLASQTEIAVQAGEAGAAELLTPGSVAANLTRWAREASYQLSSQSKAAGLPEVLRTDAGEGCASMATAF